jgi:hypothetical protein
MTFFLAWIGISGGVQLAQILFGRKETVRVSGAVFPNALPQITLPLRFQGLYDEARKRVAERMTQGKGVG